MSQEFKRFSRLVNSDDPITSYMPESSPSIFSDASFIVQKDKSQIASDVLLGLGMDSKLITTEDEMQFILDQISGFHDGVKLKRRFLMSRDGKRAIEFHRRCDNKGPTITLIRTAGGVVCGGYTSQPWRSLNRSV